MSEELRFAWNIVKEAQNAAFNALVPNVSYSIPEELATYNLNRRNLSAFLTTPKLKKKKIFFSE